MRQFFMLLAIVWTIVAQNTAAQDAQGSIANIELGQDAEHLILTITLHQDAVLTSHYLPAAPNGELPPRFYIDLEPAKLNSSLSLPSIPKNAPLTGIRAAQNTAERVRVVLDLSPSMAQKGFVSKYENRKVLVHIPLDKSLELLASDQVTEQPKAQDSKQTQSSAATSSAPPVKTSETVAGAVNLNPVETIPATKAKNNEKHRVVIDPGHGGDDPGALGPYFGSKEKDLALQIAKRLKALLERDGKYTVFMTRQSDQTLSLLSRTQFANEKQGDLFVSIHCNASPRRAASGVSTYFLHNADDQESLRVAMRENGELAAPDTSSPMGNDDYYLEVMKASMVKNFHTVLSTDLASFIQSAMLSELRRSYSKVEDLGVRSARFYVLTGATMPAVLVETSFISNRTEEQRLRSAAYQQSLALSIQRGIHNFFKAQKASPHHAQVR